MAITNDPAGYTKNYDKLADGSPLIIRPQGVLFHQGDGTIKSDLKILRGNDPTRVVSAGWYLLRTGEMLQLGPENQRYWHAGKADKNVTTWWGNEPAVFGIIDGNLLFGVESEHRSGQDWPTAQLQGLDDWGRMMTRKYAFPHTRLGAHRWYAPSRKDDPTDISDLELQTIFKSWTAVDGKWVKIVSPKGAFIRQGPSVKFPVAGALDDGTMFWSDKTIKGDAPPGTTNDQWVHMWGSSPFISAPLGFIWSGIVGDA